MKIIKQLIVFLSFFACVLGQQAFAASVIEKWQDGDFQVKEKLQSTRDSLSFNVDNHPETLKLFDKLVESWLKEYNDDRGFDIITLLDAVAFSSEKHYSQTRKDEMNTPYIMHHLEVVRFLWKEGRVRCVNVLVAALLQEILKATMITAEHIEDAFGPRVCSIVLELNESFPYFIRKNQRQVNQAPFLSLDAKLIRLADLLNNLKNLTMRPTIGLNTDEIDLYFDHAFKLVKALKGTNICLEMAVIKKVEDRFQDKPIPPEKS